MNFRISHEIDADWDGESYRCTQNELLVTIKGKSHLFASAAESDLDTCAWADVADALERAHRTVNVLEAQAQHSADLIDLEEKLRAELVLYATGDREEGHNEGVECCLKALKRMGAEVEK